MNILKVLSRIGLSCHDILIILSIHETLWWLMYSFDDGADAILRSGEDDTKFEQDLKLHPYVILQKIVSCAKLFLCCGLIWYGTIFIGKALPLRIYISAGCFVDVVLLLAWICIGVEEGWPLGPSNLFGLHYIILFFIFRIGAYYIFYLISNEMFITPLNQSVAGSINDNSVNLPELGPRTANSASNLGPLGKGFRAILDYYKIEAERAYLVAVCWDLLWNVFITISQEIPELLFSAIYIGIFGTVSIDFSTENFGFRVIRVLLAAGGIYIVQKKSERYLKVWIGLYVFFTLLNVLFFCVAVSYLGIHETEITIFILCAVFFSANLAKLFIVYTAARYYFHLKSGNVNLINENENNNQLRNVEL